MLKGFVEISNRTKQIISALGSEDDMYVHCQCGGSDVREATYEEMFETPIIMQLMVNANFISLKILQLVVDIIVVIVWFAVDILA